jgi:hypothetical protein
MWTASDDGRPRQPVTEPEILPPDHAGAGPRARGAEQIWVRQRVFVAPPGPLGVVLGLVALVALAALGVVAFLGLFLLALPLAGALIVAGGLAMLLRGPRRL